MRVGWLVLFIEEGSAGHDQLHQVEQTTALLL